MAKENPLKALTGTACFSVTGSDSVVLRACMKYAGRQNAYFICEATVNQVNQFGGYTGMKPLDYADMVLKIAEEIGFPEDKIILSGDHLGPLVFRELEQKEAMKRAGELVEAYVKAGFRKIHLDTTMPLSGDNAVAFGDDVIAKRALYLAEISERAYAESSQDTCWRYPPVYVIGSEVPVPGGTEEEEGMHLTSPESLVHTLESFRTAFCGGGLERVWQNTVAVVAQLGLEFSENRVHDFEEERVRGLRDVLKDYSGICFESHSSDYQLADNLQKMIESGVGILKVGPELTFAHREALFSLAMIEAELQPVFGFAPSFFRETLEKVMKNNVPNYWNNYYHGSGELQKLKRKYSYSDRCRYYFADEEVISARKRLLHNLTDVNIPPYVLSQFMPVQYERIRRGLLENHPLALIEDKIQSVMNRYYQSMLEGIKKKENRL